MSKSISEQALEGVTGPSLTRRVGERATMSKPISEQALEDVTRLLLSRRSGGIQRSVLRRQAEPGQDLRGTKADRRARGECNRRLAKTVPRQPG